MRLLFIIRAFERGGAERQLIELVRGLDKTRFAITVAAFYDGGPLYDEMQKIEGIRLITLHKKGRWDTLPFLWRLWRLVRSVRPQLIHGYMDMSNLLALLMGKLSGAKVIWGVRASLQDFACYDWLPRRVFQVCAWLSRYADLIIANSYVGKGDHLMHGYAHERFIVIHNGIDTEKFLCLPEAGQPLREQWNIPASAPLIGIVGRLDPQKDHPTFLHAAAQLAQKRSDVRFFCVGDGPADYKAKLQALASKLGLDKRLIWAGPHNNMPAVYNALDILTLTSSFGEGFPNVVGEAMSCGVPTIVTDVGDAARIVENPRRVVSSGDPTALVIAWQDLLSLTHEERRALATVLRNRITKNYAHQILITQTTNALMNFEF